MDENRSNVVQLPDRASRSWPTVARLLAGVLVEAGRDPTLAAEVVETLRPLYIRAWEGPSIQSGSDAELGVEAVNDWITGIVLRLLQVAAEARMDLKELQVAPQPV
jgi:hypothetical protein